ncbi:MAG: RsmF rRNA methyltransferase first C-terminal domain-containing protein [Ligilactobacillus sp.]|nr:RsmF rRNA methyltransferase first C-terminal domain-containing protein [Ligilactobacillus sp.]
MVKLPSEYQEKYLKLLGPVEGQKFLDSIDAKVQKGFRLNPLKANYQEVAYDLSKPTPHVPTGYIGSVSGRSLEHQTGYVYSQDISAMYVAQVADAQPGEKVLDLCAAPGGKSTQLAENMANQGLLVANEINRKRAAILAENLERAGALNTIVLNESPQNLASVFPGYFDKIVVDAPCSGEGMFRKDHDAIKYWHADYPAECAVLQKEILTETMQMLRPGGTLVYSTCTFAPEENEQIVAWLLERYPYLELVPIKRFAGMDAGRPDWANGNPDLTKTVRMMFHHFQGEGQFVAKLVDTRMPEVAAKPQKKKKAKGKRTNHIGLSGQQFDLWQDFAQKSGLKLEISKSDLRLSGDYLYWYHKDWPDISRLKFMRPGIMLGVFKKNRFEPSYTLALALQPEQIERVLEVTKEEWQAYVAGNTLTLTQRHPVGWYLLVCEKKPFAFGKVVDLTVKNFFPKGLRFIGLLNNQEL